MKQFLIPILVPMLAVVASGAELTFTSQDRVVGGSAGSACDDDVNDSIAAPDFGPFMASITVSVPSGASAQAMHSSTLCPNSVLATGSTSAGGAGCVGTAYAGGYSDFTVEFNLAAKRAYTLKATFAGYAAYSLSGPSLNLAAGGFKTIVNETLDLNGMLAPGSYSITLTADSNSVFDIFDQGSFDFALRVASSADLNGDTIVGGDDLGLLLAQWGPCTGCCSADLNADGLVDAADLGVLLADWGP